MQTSSTVLQFPSDGRRGRRIEPLSSGVAPLPELPGDLLGPRTPAIPPIGKDRERVLLDAWREAHWSLRMALQEVARQRPEIGLDALYDHARRCDTLLADFYQARAELLAREVRDLQAALASSARG